MSSKFRLVIFRVCSSQGAGHCPLLDYPFTFLQVHTARSYYTYTHIFQSRFSVLWNILCMFELFVFISELFTQPQSSFHLLWWQNMRNIDYLCSSLGMTYGELYRSLYSFFPIFNAPYRVFFKWQPNPISLCDTFTLTPDLHRYGPQASVKLYASGLAFNFIAETGLRPHSPKWWNRSGMTAKN